MSLQLILGNSGAGKTQALLDEILSSSTAHPQERFLVIVPEQFTMQTQKQLVAAHPRGGILNVDVLSFERLAYRVFDEVGGVGTELLEEIGKSFVLQKIALDEEKNLPTFGRKLQKPGSIEEIKSVLSELTQYDIRPEQLADISGTKISSQLSGKLKDISLIYSDFRKYLADRYMTAEEVPDVLCRIADQSAILKGSTIAFDGFTGFTPIQVKLIRRLLPIAQRILVTVTFDTRRDWHLPCREQDLFRMSSVMIGTLTSLAEAAGVPVEEPMIIGDADNSASGNAAVPRGRFASSPSLAFLERNLFRFRGEVYPGNEQDIRIFTASDPRHEVSYIARKIARLVREEGMRYRDFAVITGDLTSCGSIVRQIFSEEGIPFFLDEKRLLLHNPFVEYLRAALEACTDQYSYDSIFRMLKTGMTDLSADEIDALENYVLAFGIRGKRKWRSKWILVYRGEDPAEVPDIDAARGKVTALLDDLADALAARDATVKEKTAAVYQFCVRSRIQEKLSARENIFRGNGQYDLAREYAQVFGKIMGLLDKLVSVLGDEKIPMDDYRTLLEAGFAEEKIGIIPPGTDQVLIGDMQRSRLSDVRVLFFAGVNEGLIPKPVKEGGLLSEADRRALSLSGVELRPSPRQEMYIQRFYLYMNLTKPSRLLYLTCSLSDSQGGNLRPAYLIKTVQKIFPGLAAETESESIPERAERPTDGLEILAEGLVKLRDETPSTEWFELYSWYLRNPFYAGRVNMLLSAASRRNPQDQIGRAAEALYGNVLRNSATRLEQFAACAFAHFAQYGLKLKKREEYEFTGMDRGNVIHRALELFAGRVSSSGRKWTDLSDAERDSLSAECIRRASGDYGFEILKSSARSAYEVERMQRLMTTSVWAMQEMLRRGDFAPVGAEAEFSLSDAYLKSTEFNLGGGRKMLITGRIDRIDTCRDGDVDYVKIIDYKTGSTKFDLSKTYYGLQLQLVLYLNAAQEILQNKGRHTEPAGIFYFQIKDPIENYSVSDSAEDVRKRILKDLSASGIVSSDKAVVTHLDHALKEDGAKSDILPVQYKKDGTPYKNAGCIEPQEFASLISFVNKKVREIGTKILDGDASVSPAEYKDELPCTYCPYSEVCGFDRRVPGYEFRTLPSMKQDEAMEKIKEETGADV
jgi:ATP-dependent helicase/nuclease subunit B